MNGTFLFASSFDQNLRGRIVSSLSNVDRLLFDAKLSTSNYDALLSGWSTQVLKYGGNFHGGNSTYCHSETTREKMINTYGRTITDGRKDCNVNFPVYLPLITK